MKTISNKKLSDEQKKAKTWIANSFKRLAKKLLVFPFLDFNIAFIEEKQGRQNIIKLVFQPLNYSVTIFLFLPQFMDYWQKGRKNFLKKILVNEFAYIYLYEIWDYVAKGDRDKYKKLYLRAEENLVNIISFYTSILLKLERSKVNKTFSKEKQELEKWVGEAIKKILKVMFLPVIKFRIDFSKEVYKKEPSVEAHIQYFSKRHLAKLTLFPPFLEYWERGEKKFLQEIIIHELAHLHTKELLELVSNIAWKKELAEQIDERLASVITKYIKAILKNQKSSGKVNFYDVDFV